MADDSPVSQADVKIDTTIPHSARIWNFWLGGKDNFEVDRAVGRHVMEIFPQIVEAARQSRRFQRRADAFLAGEAGVRQFLDVGAGLPAVDNDPMVLAHARALLVGTSEDSVAYVQAL